MVHKCALLLAGVVPFASLAPARADVPADTCVLFARSQVTQQVGDWETKLTDRAAVVRLCARENTLTRAFVRSVPSKAGRAVCRVDEDTLALPCCNGTGAAGSDRATVDATRTYFASAPGACPTADSDQYVLTVNANSGDFEVAWLWWQKLRASADERRALRLMATARGKDDAAELDQLWSAFGNDSVVFRSFARYPELERTPEARHFVATFSLSGSLRRLYIVTLRKVQDGLAPESVRIARP